MALSLTINIAGSECEDNRSRIPLMILIKDENRQINFYPWDYTFFTVLLNLFSTNSSNNQTWQQVVIRPPLK